MYSVHNKKNISSSPRNIFCQIWSQNQIPDFSCCDVSSNFGFVAQIMEQWHHFWTDLHSTCILYWPVWHRWRVSPPCYIDQSSSSGPGTPSLGESQCQGHLWPPWYHPTPAGSRQICINSQHYQANSISDWIANKLPVK